MRTGFRGETRGAQLTHARPEPPASSAARNKRTSSCNSLVFNDPRSNLTVAAGSLVTLSDAPGVLTTGDDPAYDGSICIPNCGSQWFLNTFKASSNLSSIRVPCKRNEMMRNMLSAYVPSWLNSPIEFAFGFLFWLTSRVSKQTKKEFRNDE